MEILCRALKKNHFRFWINGSDTNKNDFKGANIHIFFSKWHMQDQMEFCYCRSYVICIFIAVVVLCVGLCVLFYVCFQHFFDKIFIIMCAIKILILYTDSIKYLQKILQAFTKWKIFSVTNFYDVNLKYILDFKKCLCLVYSILPMLDFLAFHVF